MKCIVRIRDRNDIAVFIPKKITADKLLHEMYKKEITRIGGEIETTHYADMKHIKIEGVANCTELYIRDLVEVDKNVL